MKGVNGVSQKRLNEQVTAREIVLMDRLAVYGQSEACRCAAVLSQFVRMQGKLFELIRSNKHMLDIAKTRALIREQFTSIREQLLSSESDCPIRSTLVLQIDHLEQTVADMCQQISKLQTQMIEVRSKEKQQTKSLKTLNSDNKKLRKELLQLQYHSVFTIDSCKAKISKLLAEAERNTWGTVEDNLQVARTTQGSQCEILTVQLAENYKKQNQDLPLKVAKLEELYAKVKTQNREKDLFNAQLLRIVHSEFASEAEGEDEEKESSKQCDNTYLSAHKSNDRSTLADDSLKQRSDTETLDHSQDVPGAVEVQQIALPEQIKMTSTPSVWSVVAFLKTIWRGLTE